MQKPDRSNRLPMTLTKEERAEIDAAANRAGVKSATYVRMKALEAARASEKGAER